MWSNSEVIFDFKRVAFWVHFGAMLDPFGSPPSDRNLSKIERKAKSMFD